MAKPSYNWDEAAAQITRGLPSNYLPSGTQGLTLSYAYRATATAPEAPAGATSWINGLNQGMTGFSQFNQTQITVMERALDLIEEVANIKLNRVGTGVTGASAYSDQAELLFGNYTNWTLADAHGSGNYVFHIDNSGNYTRAAKAWFLGTEARMVNSTYTNNATYLFLHETLHTLGLKHPGDYSVRDEEAASYNTDAIFAQDNRQYTVMSYFGPESSGGDWGNNRPLSPMMYDIAALQKIYGANMTTRTGDTVYGFNSNTGYENFTFNGARSVRVFTIWDAGGQDTLDLSGFSGASDINLEAESFSSGGVKSDGGRVLNNIAIAKGVVIENAIGGSGNDTLKGNGVANTLRGGGGNDTLDGGDGLDTAVYRGAKADYTITRNANGSYSVTDNTANRDGTDTVTNIEQLQFSDQVLAISTELPFSALFAANLSQGKAIAAAYQVLLGGTPASAGFDFLIKANLSTNFGAGAGPVFNDENIFINVANSLVQGNPTAAATFNSLASGATLAEKIASLYSKIIPVAKQTADGVAFLTRPDGLKFYQDVAKERGITAENGPAVVALASLLKVAVDAKIGIGNPISDLIASIADGSSELPATSPVVLPIETIDGTKFDADDAPDVMAGFSGSTPAPLIGVSDIQLEPAVGSWV